MQKHLFFDFEELANTIPPTLYKRVKEEIVLQMSSTETTNVDRKDSGYPNDFNETDLTGMDWSEIYV